MKTSCNHHKECLQVIQRILDKEATLAEEAQFLANKDQCLPCQEGHDLELSLKNAIKTKCSVSCPPDLFTRIEAKLFLVLILISILIPLFC